MFNAIKKESFSTVRRALIDESTCNQLVSNFETLMKMAKENNCKNYDAKNALLKFTLVIRGRYLEPLPDSTIAGVNSTVSYSRLNHRLVSTAFRMPDTTLLLF